MSIRMYASIRMDRPIDPEKHYISPGGYELIFDNDKSIQFDFNDYEGAVRKEDPTILDFIMRNLDEDSYESAKLLETHLINHSIKKIEEFYVYTGEDDCLEEINPVSIEDIAFEIFDGIATTVVSVPKDVIAAYKFDQPDNSDEFLREILMKHFGHKICIACYGDVNNPADVTLECDDCHEIIIDSNIYTCAPRTDIERKQKMNIRGKDKWYYGNKSVD